jgi:hypothetical protein
VLGECCSNETVEVGSYECSSDILRKVDLGNFFTDLVHDALVHRGSVSQLHGNTASFTLTLSPVSLTSFHPSYLVSASADSTLRVYWRDSAHYNKLTWAR